MDTSFNLNITVKLLCSFGDSEVRLDGRCLGCEFIHKVALSLRNDNVCSLHLLAAIRNRYVIELKHYSEISMTLM